MEYISGENEVQEAKNVCVLSDADAKRLFGTDDVVGMTVDVNCYGLTKKSSYLRGDNPERKWNLCQLYL